MAECRSQRTLMESIMSDLIPLFKSQRSVALIGASSDTKKWLLDGQKPD